MNWEQFAIDANDHMVWKTDEEKDKFVNAGTGKRLTKAQSAWKTRNWPIMQPNWKPKDVFDELAYTLLKS